MVRGCAGGREHPQACPPHPFLQEILKRDRAPPFEALSQAVDRHLQFGPASSPQSLPQAQEKGVLPASSGQRAGLLSTLQHRTAPHHRE